MTIERGKIVLSGAVMELFLFPHRADDSFYMASDASDDERRGRALQEAAKKLTRKINANAGQWYDPLTKEFYKPLFLTLTFAENITSIPYANSLYKKFIQRLNYRLFGKKSAHTAYATVVEFQKRGAVHYHSVLFNIPSVDGISALMASIWSHGFIKILPIDDINSVGHYLVKYMTKTNTDERLKGKKTFFTSKKLIKPYITTNDFEINRLVDAVGDADSFDFNGETLTYRKYDISKSSIRYLPIFPHLFRYTIPPVDNFRLTQGNLGL